MISKVLKPALVFCATCLVGAVLELLTDGSCAALMPYDYMVTLRVIGGLVMSLVYGLVALILGIVTFRIIRKKTTWLGSDRARLGYFALLPLVVFPLQFLTILLNLLDANSREQELCEKTTTIGLEAKSSGLTVADYTYLMEKLPLLPALPPTADSISVSFWHDGFLPDFDLWVRCRTATTDVLFLMDGKWSVDSTRADGSTRWLVFHDHEN